MILILLLAAIIFMPFVIVNPGAWGVVMQLGKVQDKVLGEGIHLIIPLAKWKSATGCRQGRYKDIGFEQIHKS
jgi:regulator of protease activity HflC (stomatin/prohibitin superfamily)